MDAIAFYVCSGEYVNNLIIMYREYVMFYATHSRQWIEQQRIAQILFYLRNKPGKQKTRFSTASAIKL